MMSKQGSMADTSTLQISRLEEIFEDDTDGIADLLEAAMQTGAVHQATLRDAVARRDIDEVMRAAHAIKGSTANVGGNDVAAVASRIETAARTKVWEPIPAEVDRLDAAYEQLRTAVAAYRASL